MGRPLIRWKDQVHEDMLFSSGIEAVSDLPSRWKRQNVMMIILNSRRNSTEINS